MPCLLIEDIIAHLLPISCHVWRLVKTELPVSERKAASLSSPRSCPGQQSQPVTPTVPSLPARERRGAGGPTGRRCQKESSSRFVAEPPRQNLPASQRKVPFSARVSESLLSDGEGSLLGGCSLSVSSSMGAVGYRRKSHSVGKRRS